MVGDREKHITEQWPRDKDLASLWFYEGPEPGTVGSGVISAPSVSLKTRRWTGSQGWRDGSCVPITGCAPPGYLTGNRGRAADGSLKLDGGKRSHGLKGLTVVALSQKSIGANCTSSECLSLLGLVALSLGHGDIQA